MWRHWKAGGLFTWRDQLWKDCITYAASELYRDPFLSIFLDQVNTAMSPLIGWGRFSCGLRRYMENIHTSWTKMYINRRNSMRRHPQYVAPSKQIWAHIWQKCSPLCHRFWYWHWIYTDVTFDREHLIWVANVKHRGYLSDQMFTTMQKQHRLNFAWTCTKQLRLMVSFPHPIQLDVQHVCCVVVILTIHVLVFLFPTDGLSHMVKSYFANHPTPCTLVNIEWGISKSFER